MRLPVRSFFSYSPFCKMAKPRTINIGFIGLGIVGQGVWKHIQRNRAELEHRLGARLVLHSAAVRDPAKKRPVRISRSRLCSDPLAVATDPKLDIVCELMGGTTLAKKATLAALRCGKIVVSANKALLCQSGEKIFQAAKKGGGHFFFEASVAGGIPIIKVIREGLVANRFDLIYGILNGTCNYILTRMDCEGLTFDETIKEARRLGYVEADESLDLDGWDTAHKAVILGYLAHGKWVKLRQVPVEGIRRITLEDIGWARDLGYKIKLLGIVSRDAKNGKVFVRVQPTLISKTKILSHVDDVFNGISVTGDIVGTTVHIGRGAGQDATASAVISDITDAVSTLLGKTSPPPAEGDFGGKTSVIPGAELADLSDISGHYYIRLSVVDKPGVLAEVSAVMAKLGVSIASVIQPKATLGKKATLILTTHSSNEKIIQETCRNLKRLKSVLNAPFLLRIADFKD